MAARYPSLRFSGGQLQVAFIRVPYNGRNSIKRYFLPSLLVFLPPLPERLEHPTPFQHVHQDGGCVG